MTAGPSLRMDQRRQLPVILQTEAAECGLACLAMIVGFHGQRIDLGTLRRRHAISMKGATLRGLMDVARQMGLATRAVRLDLEDLPKLRLPCVVHWTFNHFVVLKQVGPGSVTIHDPATGRRTLSLSDFSRGFTGVALEAEPNAEFTVGNLHNGLRLADLFRNLTAFRSSAALIFLLSVAIEFIALLMPIGSQVVVDEVIVSADRNLLLVVTIGMLLLLAVQLLVGAARTWAVMLLGTTISFQWNSSLFKHLIHLPLDFFAKRHVGDVITRFGALGTIQKSLTTDLVQAVLDGIMSVGMLIMLFVYGGWLALVALAFTALNLVIRAFAYGAYRANSEEAIVCDARQQSHFIESVRGIASIKLLGLAERRQAVWLNHFVEVLNARFRLQRLDLLFGRSSDFLFGANRLLMLVLGAASVIAGHMTLGMLVAFLAYQDQFTSRAGSLLSAGFQLRMLSLQSDRLADLVMTEAEDSRTPLLAVPAVVHPHGAGVHLTTHNLSFRYGDGEPWVFRDVTLDIPPGLCVALTGPSGCGKTTLIKTLMGLSQASQGTVLADGVDLRTMGTAAYRSQIAGVLQDDGLFAGSIGENISGFDDHPDPAWILECAARASILDDIRRMPMGLESLVGDMGSTLSGGQKQRVVLARALYRRPRILFLDEATSHLDEATESIIAAALRDLRMTRVVIAHRPATIAHADIVIPFGTILSGQLQQAGPPFDPPRRKPRARRPPAQSAAS